MTDDEIKKQAARDPEFQPAWVSNTEDTRKLIPSEPISIVHPPPGPLQLDKLRAWREHALANHHCMSEWQLACCALLEKFDAAKAENVQLRELLGQASTTISKGAEIMSLEQLSEWEGVRATLEEIGEFAAKPEGA